MSGRERNQEEAAHALSAAYRDLFLLAGWMRDGKVQGAQAAAVRAFADETLRTERRALLRAGLDEDLIADAQLAVIALLDESANGASARDFAAEWQRETLQYASYGHNNLGRDFFDRLEYRRQRLDTPLALIELLLRCLAWGFEGRYRQENRLGELGVLRETLEQEQKRRMGMPSPLGTPIEELAKLPPLPPLVRAPWVLGLGASLILLCGLLLSLLLYLQADQVAHHLRADIDGEAGAKPTASRIHR